MPRKVSGDKRPPTVPRKVSGDKKKEDKETRLKKLKQDMMEAAAAKDYKKAAQIQQEIQRVEKEDDESPEQEDTKEEEPDRLTKRIMELEKQLKEAESKFDFAACAEIQEELDRLRRPVIPPTPDAIDSDEETDELRPIVTSRRTKRRAKGSKRSEHTFWMGTWCSSARVGLWRSLEKVKSFD